MEEWIMSKKNKNYQSLDSLMPIVAVVNEAAAAVKDSNRTIVDSAISEVLAGALGATVGGAGSFAALWAIGTSAATTFSLSGAGIMGGLAAAGTVVGGGAVAGMFVLTAPVGILAVAGVGLASRARNKKLAQEKERLYQEVLKKHHAIIQELKNEDKLTKERIDYLESLNRLLERAVNDLREDVEGELDDEEFEGW